MSSRVDGNLLFGLLALQNNFISRDELVAAVGVWLGNMSRTLDAVLIEREALSSDHAELLQILVAAHVARHNNDPQQSLAALSSVGSVYEELRSIGNQQLDASLASIGATRRDGDVPRISGSEITALPSRFRFLRHHAKGGLGDVSVARDLELNREVALKEIQPQFADDEHSRRRFVLEAEITGGLEHPGIVPVYGLGQYANGRPYYAMRFIRGDSLKEATDQFHQEGANYNSLAFRTLLGCFLDVCNAIEYAHSRGVLHRDLKPGNVMLGKYGETLVVDWGLAKVTGREVITPDSGETTLRPLSASDGAPTQLGAAIGTPAYMPPEQAAGRLDQLGPASDVYSLGATLYYVLTGRAAFTGEDRGAVLRMVQSGGFAHPRSVQAHVPSALEAICRKAMALRPADRYQAPRDLADEIQRYLADEPIVAHTEPAAIRARRWLRKHPKVVAALAASLLVGVASAIAVAAVVAGKNRELATANEGLKKANAAEVAARTKVRRANEIAEQRRRAAVSAERNEKSQRERAEAVTEFMFSFFRGSNLTTNGGEFAFTDFLDQAVTRSEEHLRDQPILQAQMLDIVGQAYDGLGLQDKCLALSQRAYELRGKNLRAEDPETLDSLSRLAAAYLTAGETAQALPLLEQSVKQNQAAFGEGHLRTLNELTNLATAHLAAGDYIKARELLEPRLEMMRSNLDENHPTLLMAMADLAQAYLSSGDNAKALPLLEESLERRRATQGENAGDTLTSLSNLAMFRLMAGDVANATPLLKQCLEQRQALLGEKHPDTLMSIVNLALAYRTAGDIEKALPLYEQCYEVTRTVFGKIHPQTVGAMGSLAKTYLVSDQPDRALPLFEQFVEARRRLSAANDPGFAGLLASVSHDLLQHRQFAAAEKHLRECIAIRERSLAGDWSTFNATTLLGGALAGQGKYAEAEPLLLKGYEGLKMREAAIPPQGKVRIKEALDRLTELYTAWEKPAEAAKWRALAEPEPPAPE